MLPSSSRPRHARNLCGYTGKQRAPACAGAPRITDVDENGLQLAAGGRVPRIDATGVGVVSTVRRVVAGDVVAGLHEVVARLALRRVVTLAAVDLVVLVLAVDGVV